MLVSAKRMSSLNSFRILCKANPECYIGRTHKRNGCCVNQNKNKCRLLKVEKKTKAGVWADAGRVTGVPSLQAMKKRGFRRLGGVIGLTRKSNSTW